MNNENRSPRKEVIKNITIVLLAVLLVLTFFSNTFMNYSLPQVSAVYVSQGSISEQIRGSGTVNPAESYEVKFEQTREIKSVSVKTGDTVAAGDVLFELEDTESTEFTEAERTLESLELEYEKALLSLSSKTGYESEYLEITRAEEELSDMKKQLEDVRSGADMLSVANAEYKAAKEKLDAYTVKKEQYSAYLSAVDSEDMLDLTGDYYKRMRAAKDAVTEAEKAFDDAKKKYDEALAKVPSSSSKDRILAKQNEIEMAQATLDGYYSSLYNSDVDADTSSIWVSINTQIKTIENLKKELSALYTESISEVALRNSVDQAEKKKNKTEKALNTAKEKLASETRSVKLEIKAVINELDSRIRDAEAKVTAAQDKKTAAESAGLMTEAQLTVKISEQERKITDLKTALQKTQSTDSVDIESRKLDLQAKEKEIERQREKVEKLRSENTDAVIKAKVGGIVESLSVTAGSTVAAGSTAAVINVADMGYEMEFSVKNEQAKKVRAGDKAEITSWYWGSDFSAVLKEIKPDTANPQTQKILVFTISGSDITTGQNISLAMGSKGQTYPTVVPNSAVREDSNGKFVLVMESKSSPLGNRYTAVRYDIEVIVKDDNNSAVNGLLGSEFVITTSTKPISAGEQIRPAE